MTDNELKHLISQMLPEDVFFTADGIDFNWSNASEKCQKERRGFNVLDTELLYLCSLVEAELEGVKWNYYIMELAPLTRRPRQSEISIRQYMTATWQQRTKALAKVKGILK